MSALSESGMDTISVSMSMSGEDMSRLSADDRSQAKALLATLANLRTQEAKLDEQIKDKDRETKVQTDRRERTANLKSETAEFQRRTKEAKDYIEAAREVVNSFPGDTQILRLERKLESLQNEIKDADRTLKQRRTGVEAYQAKIRALQQDKENLLGDVSEQLGDVEADVKQELDTHATVSTIKPQDSVNTLTDVCNDREKELDNLMKQLEDKIHRDRELTSQLQKLQETVQQAIPQVEGDKNQDIQEILTEWEVEKRHLLNIYGKLCVINREQNYHLMRGTHIKRAPEKAVNDPNESRLSMDNSELAREINALKEKAVVIDNDVKALHTQLRQLKKSSDEEKKQFAVAKMDADERAHMSTDARRELQLENNELRCLKSELLNLLQGLRENQTAMQRAALNSNSRSVSPRRLEAPPAAE